jgi:methyl-accepting chemotaxis protein
VALSFQAFQQIVAGTNQQQIGFENVMKAVKDIGQASEQTASSTRQLEKAAAGLTVLAQQLRKTTDRYKL